MPGFCACDRRQNAPSLDSAEPRSERVVFGRTPGTQTHTNRGVLGNGDRRSRLHVPADRRRVEGAPWGPGAPRCLSLRAVSSGSRGKCARTPSGGEDGCSCNARVAHVVPRVSTFRYRMRGWPAVGVGDSHTNREHFRTTRKLCGGGVQSRSPRRCAIAGALTGRLAERVERVGTSGTDGHRRS